MTMINKSQLKRTSTLLLLFMSSSQVVIAEEKSASIIAFDSDQWTLSGNATIEEDYLGKKALKLGAIPKGQMIGIGEASLKDNTFTRGTIEYDVAFDNTPAYAGVKFRIQPNQNHERFYMRAEESGKPDANQYMPVYNGVPSWQLYYGEAYGIPSQYDFNQWMHVKIVVAEKLADIYIKDMQAPALTVQLKQETRAGSVGLWALNFEKGDVRFANFSLTPMDKPEIKGTPKPEKVAETGIIPVWSVSETFDEKLLDGKTLLTEDSKRYIKGKEHALKYILLNAEATGVTNLAQIQGIKKGQDTVFTKAVISSETEQVKKLDFGFSDKVKVYLNNQLIFSGNDAERSRDFSFLGTVGFYDALYLPLKKGQNELLFAVTESVENPNGWAVQGKFDNMQGLTFKRK